MWETWVQSLGWKNPQEKRKATHSIVEFYWRIPWTVWSMGSQRVRHDWATFTFSSPHSHLPPTHDDHHSTFWLLWISLFQVPPINELYNICTFVAGFSITSRRFKASQVAQWWRIHLPAQETQEMRVQSLGQEDPLEQEMATHSSTLAWKIPWTEEFGGLQSLGSQRVGHDWAYTYTHVKNISFRNRKVDLYHLNIKDCTLETSGFIHVTVCGRFFFLCQTE